MGCGWTEIAHIPPGLGGKGEGVGGVVRFSICRAPLGDGGYVDGLMMVVLTSKFYI